MSANLPKHIDTTAARCGTCMQICDPFRSDEGYSHCCNDRIEYPGEYLNDEWFFDCVREGQIVR